MELKIRHLMKPDLPAVVGVEDAWSTYVKEDLDFGRVMLKTDWVLDSFDIMEMVKKAQVMVVERGSTIVGFFAFENQSLVIDLQHLAVRPGEVSDIVDRVIVFLKNRATQERQPKIITFHIRDRDEAHIRTVLPSFIKAGFSVKLARDHFDGDMDGWQCRLEVSAKNKPDNNNMELTCP